MAASKRHPTIQEGLIVVGAAIAFTLDYWEEYCKTCDMDVEGAEEIKAIYEHLMADAMARIEINELVQNALVNLARGLFGKGKEDA